MPGVVSKAAVFGLVWIVLPHFPEPVDDFRELVLVLGPAPHKSGAEHAAYEWAGRYDVKVDPLPREWETAADPDLELAADLITAAKATTFEGVGGKYNWDEKGDVKDRTFAAITVKDGHFVSTGVKVDETGLDALR